MLYLVQYTQPPQVIGTLITYLVSPGGETRCRGSTQTQILWLRLCVPQPLVSWVRGSDCEALLWEHLLWPQANTLGPTCKHEGSTYLHSFWPPGWSTAASPLTGFLP